MMTQRDPDPLDKAAAREAELEEVKERREIHEKKYGSWAISSSLSFFVTLLLLLPLHWILPHDSEWLIITHMVVLAIVGGDAVSKVVVSRGGSRNQDQ
jgi:hypothetical protein